MEDDRAAGPSLRSLGIRLTSGSSRLAFVALVLGDGIAVVNPACLGPYFPWRLLIDQHCQGRGYASAALLLVVEYVRARPGARVLLPSVGRDPASPIGFYLRQGCRATGELREHELVLRLDLLAPRSSGSEPLGPLDHEAHRHLTSTAHRAVSQ